MPIYIYALRCPLTEMIRYIGKSDNPDRRRRGHIQGAINYQYNHHTARWLRKILAEDLLPEIVILEEVGEGERWQEAERRWIALGREQGWPLTNSTAGGEGLDYINPEDEARYKANLSRALKEVWSTPERREEARKRNLAAWADPKITARRIASFVSAQNRPEVKAKLALAMAEVNARPEVKAIKSAKMKAAWQKEEYRAIITAARNDPQFLEAQSKRLEERWKDPKARQRMQEARWTEEKRAAQAKRVLDPERQAKIQAAKTTPEARARKSAEVREWWARRRAESQG